MIPTPRFFATVLSLEGDLAVLYTSKGIVKINLENIEWISDDDKYIDPKDINVGSKYLMDIYPGGIDRATEKILFDAYADYNKEKYGR